MIRVFDAFSGIGGFRSAFERVGGFKTVGWCEIDRFAQKSYRALFDTGGEQFYENIRDIDTAGLADFDLLVGGFPCQPFSVAGKRHGTADERGNSLDIGLLRSCVSRIWVSHFCTIEIELINGTNIHNIMERSASHGNDNECNSNSCETADSE